MFKCTSDARAFVQRKRKPKVRTCACNISDYHPKFQIPTLRNVGCSAIVQWISRRPRPVTWTSCNTFEYRCSQQPLCPFIHHLSTKGCGGVSKTSAPIVNEDFARGALAVGIGFSHAQELTACLNIPFMSTKLYEKCETTVGNEVASDLMCSMKEAAIYEAQLARERGETPDAEGFWRIPAIVDGGWSRHSYGLDYSANSGLAVIISRYSKQILHIRIKNKFCTVCQRVRHKNEEPGPHKSAKKWISASTAKSET